MDETGRQIILTFHGIGKPPALVPEDERPYWIMEAAFVEMIGRLSESARHHRITLSVTFDDGNKSDILIAAPVLRAHDLPGRFFPCAGRLEKSGYLDHKDILTLVDNGFEIGSHGMDHLPWATLKGAHLRRETVEAKALLERAAGQTIQAVALPFGSYNRRVLAAVRAAGYTRVFSSDPGPARPGAWFVRRFSYREGVTFDLPELMADYTRPSQRLFGAAKYAVKSLR